MLLLNQRQGNAVYYSASNTSEFNITVYNLTVCAAQFVQRA